MSDYKSGYRNRVMRSVILALAVLLTGFYLGRERRTLVAGEIPVPDIEIKVLPPPVTEQHKKPPRPSRPVIGSEEEEPEMARDVEIEQLFSAAVDFEPPPPDDEPETFLPYSEAPVLVKSVLPVYPPLARRAGASGTVFLKIFVNDKGRVEKAEVIKSIPMLDQAAIDAVRRFVFKPAMQRDRPVGVWISIPVRFVLN